MDDNSKDKDVSSGQTQPPVSQELLDTLSENLQRIRSRIAESAEKAGRAPEEIKLLPATKYADATVMKALLALGLKEFGENQVQQAECKAQVLGSGVTFHMIGHLQRNKVKRALKIFASIQSVDSIRLAEEISRRAGDRKVPVLLEVNIGREPQKYGFLPEELVEALGRIEKLENLEVLGLMTVPPWKEDPEEVRPYFRRLKELREEALDRGVGGTGLPELSMGMSHDFTVAIEEGATCVRIGSALFGRTSCGKLL